MNILSIQSFVAYGHVGNSAAVFPLQRMGFEVWPVNTVHLKTTRGTGSGAARCFPPRTSPASSGASRIGARWRAAYPVPMDLPEAEPDGSLPSVEGLLGTIRKTILPSLEALTALKAQGRVLAGGYPSGQRSTMLIVEAGSEEGGWGCSNGCPVGTCRLRT